MIAGPEADERLTGEDGKLEAARHWEEIFGRLEEEKFSTDKGPPRPALSSTGAEQ
jgi:hypothetical protein